MSPVFKISLDKNLQEVYIFLFDSVHEMNMWLDNNSSHWGDLGYKVVWTQVRGVNL